MFAADIVGDPAEERTPKTIEDPVERDRKGQRGHLEAQKTDGLACDLEVVSNRRDLRRGHQAACGDHHEHQIHHPEDRAAQHLRRREVDPGLGQVELFLFDRHRLRGLAKEKSKDEDDQALADAECEKSGLVAARRNHVRNRHHRDRSAGAEAGGGRACRKATAVRKPF